MATNDQLLQALMKRQQMAKAKAASANKRQRGLDQRAAQPLQGTVGGGGFSTSVGGRQMQIPQEERINWGGIAEKGFNSYKASKGNKQIEEAEEEEVDAEFDVAEAIYQGTMKDDPEGAKLIGLTRAGVPGAEAALTKHLAPKTQSLAVIVQAMTSGQLDPDMAAELAGQFGLSPEMVKKGAQYAADRKELLQNQKFDQQAMLKGMGGSGGGGGKLGFDEYQSMTPEEQAAYDRFSGRRGGKEQGGLTAGQLMLRDKELLKAEASIRDMSEQQYKFEQLRPMLDDPDAFGPGQSLAIVASQAGNPVISAVGTKFLSAASVKLEDYLNQEVLRRMSMLGGNDSNEELNRMRASLPKITNNPKAALELLDDINKWQSINKQALQLRQEAIAQKGAAGLVDENGKSRDFYKEVKSGVGGGITGKEPSPRLDSEKPSGKIEILEILP